MNSETLLCATNRSGQRMVASIHQNGVQLHTSALTPAVEDASPCVSMLYAEFSENTMCFRRSVTQDASAALFTIYSNGKMAIEPTAGEATDLRAIQSTLAQWQWNFDKLCAVHPIATVSSTAQPSATDSLLLVQARPLRFSTWKCGNSIPIKTFETNFSVRDLHGSAVMYERTGDATYAPLTVVAADTNVLSVFSMEKLRWAARNFFVFENIEVKLRLVAFCTIPNIFYPNSTKNPGHICAVTSNGYLLVYQPMQSPAPIAVIRMQSLKSAPRVVQYAGGASVIVGDMTGMLVLFDLQALVADAQKLKKHESVQLADDRSVRRIILIGKDTGVVCVAPIDFGASGSLCQADAVPTKTSGLSPYFFLGSSDRTVQLLATWSAGKVPEGTVQRVSQVMLHFVPSPMRCVLMAPKPIEVEAVEGMELEGLTQVEQKQRFIRSRGPYETIAQFLERDYPLAKQLLGWDSLEDVSVG